MCVIPWASRYHNEALSLQQRWCLFPLFRVRYYLSTLRISLHACHDGLDKVAHVAHVPGSASVRRSRLRHWTTGFPRSRRLSRPWPRLRTSSRLDRAPHLRHCRWQEGRPAFKFPAVDGYLARLTRRRTAAGGDASAAWLRLLSPTFAFRAWLWVLWDDRNGCSGPDVRVGTSRLGRRDFRTLQTTFPMN